MKQNIKQKIRNNFNKAANSYDRNCAVQKAVCEKSIQLLLNHKDHFSQIADFACGTGESTLHLVQNVKFEKCFAIDFAEKLLTTAQKKLIKVQKINFILGNLDEPLFVATSFDLVFCNMALQWSLNIPKAIELFQQYLMIDGKLLFSIPTADNFPEIKSPFKPKLPSYQAVIQILLDMKFKLLEARLATFAITFQNQLDLLRSLKSTGANYNKLVSSENQSLAKINLEQIFTHPKNIQLTYNVAIFLARK